MHLLPLKFVVICRVISRSNSGRQQIFCKNVQKRVAAKRNLLVCVAKILRKSAAGRMQKTLKLTDVARYLGTSKRTLYNMIEDGRFPVQPIPDTKPRRWNIEDIDAWRKPNSNRANA